ncbi:hypothetical protein D3C76_1234400 [compost metagenome]
MMLQGDKCKQLISGRFQDDIMSVFGMTLHLLKFFRSQFAWFSEYLMRNLAFAYINQVSCFTYNISLILWITKPSGDIIREHADLHGVIVCIIVFVI